MSEYRAERPEWASLHRLVQDLITGVVRRHTFTQWELEFLLDLQNSRLRKSSRDGMLRKYLRAVHQHAVEGAPEPPRLCTFLDLNYRREMARFEGHKDEASQLSS